MSRTNFLARSPVRTVGPSNSGTGVRHSTGQSLDFTPPSVSAHSRFAQVYTDLLAAQSTGRPVSAGLERKTDAARLERLNHHTFDRFRHHTKSGFERDINNVGLDRRVEPIRAILMDFDESESVFADADVSSSNTQSQLQQHRWSDSSSSSGQRRKHSRVDRHDKQQQQPSRTKHSIRSRPRSSEEGSIGQAAGAGTGARRPAHGTVSARPRSAPNTTHKEVQEKGKQREQT